MRIRKSRWYQTLTRGMTGLALGMFFSVGGAIAELPEPPANSDIALRIVPSPQIESPLDREQLQDHPVFRLIRRAGAEAFGIEPLKFMDSTFEGTFVAAILSRSNEDGTTLADFFQDRDLREEWSRNTEEVRSLADDLEVEFAESDEGYPAELQTYLDEVRYYEPYLSDGVTYRYERLNDGKDFRITMSFSNESGLQKLGAAPSFSSRDGHQNLTPTAPPVPLNVVVGARIKEKDELASLLTEMIGQPKDGFWRTDEDVPFVVTIRGDWVVGSDRMENLGGFLKSLNGEAPGWSSTPAFQKVARNIDTEGPFILFVNTPSLIKAAGGQMGEIEQKLSSLAGPIGYAGVPYDSSQFRLEVFIGIEAPAGSQLESFMAGSDAYSPEQVVDVGNIPWDVSNVLTVDYNNTKALFDSIIALFPEAESQMDMGEDVMLGMLGLDAEAGLDRLFEGTVLVSFERIDILAAGIESALQELDGFDIDPEPDADSEEEPKRASPLAFVPATFAAQMPLEVNRSALIRMLEPYQGDVSTRDLFGVDMITSEDKTFSYAVDGDWFYLSGGRTDRLLRHLLEAAHGRKDSLASIDSWSRFVVGRRGRLIGFGHQKVDPVYSLVKGFLLFFGSDFRPLATELGKLRDYHSMGTVVPDGIMLVGEVVQGDGR